MFVCFLGGSSRWPRMDSETLFAHQTWLLRLLLLPCIWLAGSALQNMTSKIVSPRDCFCLSIDLLKGAPFPLIVLTLAVFHYHGARRCCDNSHACCAIVPRQVRKWCKQSYAAPAHYEIFCTVLAASLAWQRR